MVWNAGSAALGEPGLDHRAVRRPRLAGGEIDVAGTRGQLTGAPAVGARVPQRPGQRKAGDRPLRVIGAVMGNLRLALDVIRDWLDGRS
jgi:hypothetical protein